MTDATSLDEGLEASLDPVSALLRAGACGSDLDLDLAEATPKAAVDPDAPLPLVCWLRGDEAWCAEFDLSADRAMEILGIRRSRLTQISGRELRVGRMRKGRYVSPVYRTVDVLEYREWTRPPTTHQKAAEVLDQVAERFDQRQGELASDISELALQIREQPRLILEALLPDSRETKAGLVSLANEVASRLDSSEKTNDRQFLELSKAVSELNQKLNRALAANEAILSVTSETAGLVRVLREELLALRAENAVRKLPKRRASKARVKAVTRAVNRESKAARPASGGGTHRASQKACSGSSRRHRKPSRG